jgi:hypothetical protein
MQKKILYSGLLLLAVAVILFFVIGVGMPFKDILTKSLTTTNVTISSSGFSYVPIATSNAMMIAIYMVIGGNANIYLLNESAFYEWSSNMHGNSSANGLALVRQIAIGNKSIIISNSNSSQILLTQNTSAINSNESIAGLSSFNGTAYVVIDNSNGSESRNMTLKAVVSYFKLTQSSLNTYKGMGMQILIATGIDIILVIAGIVLLVYGALKKSQNEIAIGGKQAEEAAVSKEYIDALYKKVGKKNRKKANRK